MTKQFVPCYKVIIRFYDLSDKVFCVEAFEVDYFRKDIAGVDMFLHISDSWAVPYKKTTITFERL